MPDFQQTGPITTLHAFGNYEPEPVEGLLREAVRRHPIGLVLPVTASDMRAPAFQQIVDELAHVDWVARTVVALDRSADPADYRQAQAMLEPLGERTTILWTFGERIQSIYQELNDAGLDVSVPGKGRSVWTAFGFLMADPSLRSIALHDCDIVTYDRSLLARLCLPLAHRSFDFEFCKAYYARWTDQLHGRVVRILVSPLLRALTSTIGHHPFLDYLGSFRYPLAGEFAVSASLARSIRVASDWGLEVSTLSEVFRNTSVKRVCQVDVCERYDHKHQPVSLEDPQRGLTKMSNDILLSVFRTLSSMGVELQPSLFVTLRAAFLRAAQDAIRQYDGDSLINGLRYDRHDEEQTAEGFAEQIVAAGEEFQRHPLTGNVIPNWVRVLAAFPDLPERICRACDEDREEFA